MNWLALIGAFVGGLLVGLGGVIVAMRNLMMVEKKIEGNFESACNSLEEKVASTMGWGMPMESLEMGAELEEKGHDLNNIERMRNYYLCKAPYAARILDKFPFVSAMMPCSWAVYEKTDGDVYLAQMNIPLMSKMFFGNIIGSTMSRVGEEEENMVEEILS